MGFVWGGDCGAPEICLKKVGGEGGGGGGGGWGGGGGGGEGD